MRTVTVTEFVSLDGVVQAPGTPEEDPSGGFALGGWVVPFHDEVIGAHIGEVYGRGCDLLLGRLTYDIWAGHWPFTGDDMGRTLTAATKYVASTTLAAPTWEGTVVLGPDVAAEVSALKEVDGPDLLVAGSARLVQTLLAADLVDQFELLIHPVVLGAGKRLFGDGAIPRALRPVASAVSPSGVVLATYERAGAVEVGTFADGV